MLPERPRSDGSSPARRILLAGSAALVLVTALCYLPLLANDFVNFDDDRFIYENDLIRTLDTEQIGRFFSTQIFTPGYKPLVYLSWAVEYSLFGLEPRAFHLGNLALHIINSLLVLVLLVRLAERVPRPAERKAWVLLWGAAFFALHPLRVESVAWATERKDVLFALFYLLALLAYVSYCRGNRRQVFVSALFFLLASLSKGMAITLPAALIVVDLSLERPMGWRRIREKWPFAPIFLLALWLYGGLTTLSSLGGSSAGTVSGEHGLSITFAGFRYLTFLRRLLLPGDLAPFYRAPDGLAGPSPAFVALIIGGLVAVGGLLVLLLRRERLAGAGLLFYSVTLLPALAVAGIATNLVPDRYTYLPSIGFAALLATAVGAVGSRSRAGSRVMTVVCVAWIVTLSLMTFQQAGIWRNSIALWDHVVATQGPHPIPLNNRGVAKRAAGDLAGAIEDFDHAIVIDPSFAVAYYSRSNARFELGDLAGGLEDVERATSLASERPLFWRTQGTRLGQVSRMSEAIDSLDRSIALDPTNAASFLLRGGAKAESGLFLEAIADFSVALELGGVEVEARVQRAAAWLNSGDFAAAVEENSRVLEISPDEERAFNNRGLAHFYLGELHRALKDYDRAIELRSGYALALRNRGDVRVAMQQTGEGCRDWRAALEMRPAQPELEQRIAEFCVSSED